MPSRLLAPDRNAPQGKAYKGHSTVLSSAVIATALVFSSLLVPSARASKASGNVSVSSHPHGYLGVDIRDVPEERLPALHLKEQHGAEIVHVDHDSPAGKAGLRTGDVILQMNTQTIDGVESLTRMLHDTAPGRAVTIVLNRDGQSLTIVTTLANREEVERKAWEQHLTVPEPTAYPQPAFNQAPAPAPPANPLPRDLPSSGFLGQSAGSATSTKHGPGGMLTNGSFSGATLEMLGPQLAEFFGVSASDATNVGGGAGQPNNGADNGPMGGLLVRSIEPHTPAALAGLRAGDIILRANQVPIMTGADWTKVMHECRGRAIPVFIMRDKGDLTLTLTPDSKHRSALILGPLGPAPLIPGVTLATGRILPLGWME